MKHIAMILLSWYFIVSGDTMYSMATQGPFESKEQCEELRQWAISRRTNHSSQSYYVSWCWYSKKQA